MEECKAGRHKPCSQHGEALDSSSRSEMLSVGHLHQPVPVQTPAK